jgi:preprotein translocase subunit SecG
MQNVVLVIHLILALCLIGVVLLQRSEGGGLGMGSGGGGGGVMTGRQAATALAKLTWIFAAGFFATSVTLTVLAARAASVGSVVDQPATSAPVAPTGPAPLPQTTLPSASDLLPPSPTGTAPATGTPAPAAPSDAPAAPPRAGN